MINKPNKPDFNKDDKNARTSRAKDSFFDANTARQFKRDDLIRASFDSETEALDDERHLQDDAEEMQAHSASL